MVRMCALKVVDIGLNEDAWHTLHGWLYRVAQNKMTHRTKCNFSAARGVYSITISGFIEKRRFSKNSQKRL